MVVILVKSLYTKYIPSLSYCVLGNTSYDLAFNNEGEDEN